MGLQEMREARHTPAVLFQNYLRCRKDNKIVCFFEGETDRYYYFNILDGLLKTKFLMFPCEGKDNLLKLLHLVENERKTTNRDINLMFFMDGDFLNKIKYAAEMEEFKNDLFILEAYSFENYYCSNSCINKILIREFGVKPESEILKSFIEALNKLKEEANPAFTILNKSFYILRELRNFDCKNISFDKLKAITYDLKNNEIVIEDLSYESVAEFYQVEEFNDEEIAKADKFFFNKDLYLYGRGHSQIKLIAYFFRQLYKKIKNNQIEIDGNKVRFSCKVDFGSEIVEHCAYAAEKPTELIDFIVLHSNFG